MKDKNKKSILFIAHLTLNGGIEERLFKQIEIMKESYNIFIIASAHSYNYAKIMMDASSFVYTIDYATDPLIQEKYLRRIIASHNIDFTCFEVGYFAEKINHQNLKIGKNKLVLILHGIIYNDHFIQKINLKPFDAVFAVRASAIDYIAHKNKHLFLNGVLEFKNYYQMNKSNKILITCRIDRENLPFIKTAVHFAQENNLKVDFAGKSSLGDEENLKQEILNSNSAVNFIGYIDTLNYLKQYNTQYLFIAGVGQFIMESISLGFPALFVTHSSDIVFINKDNFLTLYNDNFSPHIVLESNQSDVNKDLSLIRDGNIQKFNLIEEAKKYMLFKDHVYKFMEIIEKL